MQPVMPRTTSGRALSAASCWSRANTRSSAFSRTAQVLIRMRSARAGSSVRPYPPRCSKPEDHLGVGDVHLAAVGLDVGQLVDGQLVAAGWSCRAAPAAGRRSCTRSLTVDV